MSDANGIGDPEPRTSDKIYFWLGGSLPDTFSAWARARIRSTWFPLRRMVPVIVVAAMWFAFSLDSDRSLGYRLSLAGLPILIALVGTFMFRDRMRRRELRRYQTREVD